MGSIGLAALLAPLSVCLRATPRINTVCASLPRPE